MTEPARGRGWAAVAALALAAMLLSVVQPALLIFLPLALLFVALPPRRPVLLAIGVLIGWLVFRTEPAADLLWYFERGWALLVGAWFLVLVALRPDWRFLPRALGAVLATALTVAVFMVVNREGFTMLDTAIADDLRRQVATAMTVVGRTGDPERIEEFRRMITLGADLKVKLFPALLALGSLAGLGVAWWAFGRLAQGERHPLGRLREFRFRDELVWVFIAGLVLLLLPLNQVATRAGENLLTFMAALYALRGLAVLVVIGGVSGPLAWVVGTVVVILLTPFVMATTFIVGLSDTWLDIRARREASSSPGS